jgi:hypothetical protein
MERSEEPGGNPASAKLLMNGVLPEMGVSDAENSSMRWMKANASGERDPSFHSTSYPATDWQYKHSEEYLTLQHATIRLIVVGPEGYTYLRWLKRLLWGFVLYILESFIF